MSPQIIIEHCQRRGINCIAITDHNEIGAALEMEKMGDIKIIVGEEVKTREGEIIGLFIKEKIPPALSPEETVGIIKEQGGLVYIPHPFSRWRRTRIKTDALERIRKDIDILEVFNGRNLSSSDNLRAEQYATEHNIPMGVGTDSHITWELGGSYVEINDFSSPGELLMALRNGCRVTNLSNPVVHFGSTYVRIRKNLCKFLDKMNRMEKS